MIKAVIYDMDGLFVDSEALHVKCWVIFLSKYGHDINDVPGEMRGAVAGMRVIDYIRDLVKIFDFKKNPEELYEEREKIWIEIAKEELGLMPGAMESLDFFKSRGFRIAIASSGSRDYISAVLEKFSLRKYFDVVVTGDDVKKGKPDPEPYLVTVEKLGLKPEECLVLEDAEKGVRSAKDAGCICIGIDNPDTPPQDLSKADLVMDSLEEITPEIISSLSGPCD